MIQAQPGEQILLQQLWQRTQFDKTRITNTPVDEAGWEAQVRLVEQLGKGMEETMRYLYAQRPSLEEFIEWIHPATTNPAAEERIEEDVLTAEDLAFWNENGYIVIKNAVTPRQAADAEQAIWQYLGANPAQPETWYRGHEDLRGMMLTFYHHPALEANRKSPRIRRAYEQLYGTTDIHRNLDKVSFNPPENNNYYFLGSPLHWDVSLKQPIPFRLQGLLYLTDTDAHNGAFHCVPGFHRTVGQWMDSLPEGVNPRDEALATLIPIPITGNAGDFIIWHQALPHCATPNRGQTPRMVQYFTYLRPDIVAQDVWI